ncbi:MAG: ATP-binding protein [Gammaproteobacteria bacterium]|nr:ATP-binding protein [Gammaproteobacteria bacterium]
MGQGVHVLSLSRLIPHSGSILVRTSIVTVASALIVAATAIVSFNLFALEPLTKRSAADKADLMTSAANTWGELPPSRREPYAFAVYASHQLNITEDRKDLPLIQSNHRYYGLLSRELEKRAGGPVQIMQDKNMTLWVDLPTPSGTSLRVGFNPELPHVQQVFVGLSLLGVVVAIMLIISFLVVRRISRPLKEVAEAAATFRGVGTFDPLPETGLDEFRLLAKSFNTMAEEIETLIANRTTLSAGISHDLRTPLTRMSLAVELLPKEVDPKLVDRFRENLASMETLISDAAYFAKGEAEVATKINVRRLVRATVQSIDEHIQISWDGAHLENALLARGALQRCIANLVVNAKGHAFGARVRVAATDDQLQIHVLDDGPGIAKKDRMRILQPFVRLEESRNVKTGGSGLGLAIVAQLCQIHDWLISIGESESGGTDATLSIPISKNS